MEDLSDRHATMMSRLQKREEERLEQKARRRAQRLTEGKDTVKSGAFLPWLMEMKSNIMKRLLALNNGDSEDLEKKENALQILDQLMEEYHQLQQTVTEIVHSLTPFEMEQCRIELQSLMDAIQMHREKLQPKKKFAFGRTKRASKGTSKVEKDSPINKIIPTTITESETFCGFRNENNAHLVLTTEDVLQRDVTLDSLVHCKVFIGGLSGSISISHMKNCICICGPSYRSVWVECCSNCTLVLAGQQIRIHDSNDCKIYTCSRSGPIIENSSTLLFAPYAIASSPDLVRQLTLTQLEDEQSSTKKWSEVEDFNHLVRDLTSPNWSTLPVEDRECFQLPL